MLQHMLELRGVHFYWTREGGREGGREEGVGYGKTLPVYVG